MNSTLLKQIESRNTFLEKEFDKLKSEQIKCSQRSSEIQFILMGIKGEIAANRQIIEEIKKVKKINN